MLLSSHINTGQPERLSPFLRTISQRKRYPFVNFQVRGLTDSNALNYRGADNDKDRTDATETKSSLTKNLFERDIERDGDLDSERGDARERRIDDRDITIQDFKDLKERDRDTSSATATATAPATTTTTHSDHSSNNKRRRKNSSNCDNSLISTYNTNVQERHYSQDSQVGI